MKIAAAAIVAAGLLAPSVVAAPPGGPEVVNVAVGADRATGFVAGDGRVVTVAHVLGGGPGQIVVRGRDGVTRPATVLRADPRLDLAVLRVPGLRGGQAPVAAAGDEARILTADAHRPARVVRRIAARLDGAFPRPALELRADVAIGDSGAPVVTPGGGLAGIVFARSRAREGTAYAIDAAAVERLLRTPGPLD